MGRGSNTAGSSVLQVSQEAAELRGSLRFMACLFKEHLLPITFIHALVLDFLSHAQASQPASLRTLRACETAHLPAAQEYLHDGNHGTCYS